MDGVLNINKPAGMTSHDVVRKVRGLLKEKRIGHTGTLDPLATGVLVLCVGKATRIARYLEAGEKEYRAIMRLGVTTDTLDSDGKVLETRSYTPPAESEIKQIMQGYTGIITQRPPIFSALKVAGVPSYKLARAGNAEPLKERQITIFSLAVLEYENPFITISVHCSKGTYIRTLCDDIGARLGMGAHLTGLVRTRSGGFGLDRAFTLEQLSSMIADGNALRTMVSMDDALVDFPVISVDRDEAVKIGHGNKVAQKNLISVVPESRIRIHGPSGNLLAIAKYAHAELIPEIVFS